MNEEKLYHKWGPLLLAAIVRIQIKENNKIREHLGIPLITGQQTIDAIADELENIPKYDWMNREIP